MEIWLSFLLWKLLVDFKLNSVLCDTRSKGYAAKIAFATRGSSSSIGLHRADCNNTQLLMEEFFNAKALFDSVSQGSQGSSNCKHSDGLRPVEQADFAKPNWRKTCKNDYLSAKMCLATNDSWYEFFPLMPTSEIGTKHYPLLTSYWTDSNCVTTEWLLAPTTTRVCN